MAAKRRKKRKIKTNAHGVRLRDFHARKIIFAGLFFMDIYFAPLALFSGHSVRRFTVQPRDWFSVSTIEALFACCNARATFHCGQTQFQLILIDHIYDTFRFIGSNLSGGVGQRLSKSKIIFGVFENNYRVSFDKVGREGELYSVQVNMTFHLYGCQY
jgi:hypothetical protein